MIQLDIFMAEADRTFREVFYLSDYRMSENFQRFSSRMPEAEFFHDALVQAIAACVVVREEAVLKNFVCSVRRLREEAESSRARYEPRESDISKGMEVLAVKACDAFLEKARFFAREEWCGPDLLDNK